MSPRPRKRARPSSSPTYESESELELGFEDKVTPSGAFLAILPASQGLLALPLELISLIVSHLPEIGIEHILSSTRYVGSWESSGSAEFLVRFNTLRALSQLSRLSRLIFLPLHWERFEVCLFPKPNPESTEQKLEPWYQYLGQSMERRCEGLLESPHLWPYIKIVTVSINRHRSHIVLPLFARLLGMLPNVHTLEVLPGGYTMAIQSLKKYFEGCSFPSIQKVVLPTFAHDILRCCPRVREVICNTGEGRQVVGALVHTGCSKLEILRGIPVSSILSKRLSKVNPPLKCVRINGRTKDNLTESAISTLLAFSSLRVIEIEAGENDNLDEATKFACDTLRRCAQPKKVTKSWNLRESTKNVRLANAQSPNLGSRLVRILRYTPAATYSFGRTPKHFVPVKIEEYPVEI